MEKLKNLVILQLQENLKGYTGSYFQFYYNGVEDFCSGLTEDQAINLLDTFGIAEAIKLAEKLIDPKYIKIESFSGIIGDPYFLTSLLLQYLVNEILRDSVVFKAHWKKSANPTINWALIQELEGMLA